MNIKNKIGYLLGLIASVALISSIAYAAVPITFPVNGGTGTSTIPVLGQVLVGQSNGTYAPQATSTLGISGSSSFSTNPFSATYLVATGTPTSTFAGNISVNSTATVSTIGNLAGTLDATAFLTSSTTADIGAQINAAYAALPSTGGTITVPNGTFSFTTPVSFGKTLVGNAAITIASPAVITMSNNFSVGGVVIFSTTGALPTGLNAGTNYYVISAGLSSSQFEVSTSAGGSAVNTSGTQSGTQSVTQSFPNKIVRVVCAAGGEANNNIAGIYTGTTLLYTGTTGSSFTWDTNASITSGSGMENCNLQGTNGTTARTSIGITVGGSNGGFSHYLENVNLNGFGYGISYVDNTSFTLIDRSNVHFNGRNVVENDTPGANGENMRIINSVIADSNDRTGGGASGTTEASCIYVQESGNVQWNIINSSIDDCQFNSDQFGGTANLINFTNDHFENPNTQVYTYAKTRSNTPATEMHFIGGDMMNDVTTGMPQFIEAGGDVTFSSFTLDINSPVTIPVTRAVALDFGSNNATVSWTGLVNNGNTHSSVAVTYVYGTAPFAPWGYGTGLGDPSFYIASTSPTVIGHVGIGTSNPTANLTVQGKDTSNPFLVKSSAGNNLFTVNTSGDVIINNGTVATGILGSTLTNAASTTSATSYVTSSITPTANNLLEACVASQVSSGGVNIPTLTGDGVTWVEVTHEKDYTGNRQITLFRALSASPSSGALTADFAGQTQLRAGWTVSQFSGVDTSGSNGSGAIVQSAVASTTDALAVAGINVNLSAFSNVNNATFGCVREGAGNTITQGSGFTQLAQSVSSATYQSEWKAINDTSVDWTWASVIAISNAIGVEIKAANATGIGTVLIAKTSGNVGIGTSTPQSTLSIQATSGTDPFTISSSTNNIFGIDAQNHKFTGGVAPAISSCGTGTGTVVGDDQTGTITTATAATACTMTFAQIYTNIPSCNVTDNSLVGFADIASISTTTVTFGISSALTGGNLYYSCGYHR